MNMPLLKKHLLILGFILAGSVSFLLPVQGLCSGTVPLNKGTMITVTDADDAGTGGPESSLLNLKYSGAAESDRSRKTLRARAKASPDAKASYCARMGTRFSILKGKV